MKVAIVMSTYNGEKYIREQLDSIINQSNITFDLYIRDDGSNDNTVEIIKEYANKDNRIHLNVGKNKGFRRSFVDELLRIKSEYDYYAFSDQDDFWEKEKIKKAISFIEEHSNRGIPTVYYSNLKKCDEKLNCLSLTKLENRKKSIESNYLRRSIAGCTIVFNNSMYNILKKGTITDNVIIRGHDSLLITLCYAIGGKVLLDSNSYIKYRIHNNNTSGSSKSLLARIRKEWNNFFNKSGKEAIFAGAIIDTWGDFINEKSKKTLSIIKNSKKMRNRFIILLNKEFSTGDVRLTIIGKLKVLLGLM